MSSQPSLRVVIACGGTGGHLFPGIAVAQRLKERGHAPLVLISEKVIDALAAKGHPDLAFATVPNQPRPPLLSPKVFGFIGNLWKSWSLVKKIIKEHKADAVLGMGGFTSLMPILAGRKFKAKTFLHESNAIPGKANRWSAKKCDLVFVGWKECAGNFPRQATKVVGTPLRLSLENPPSREKAAEHFGLQANAPTLIVMGGSQGARGVNRALIAALSSLPESLQILHITGPGDHAEVQAGYAGAKQPHQVLAFCHEMEMAYALGDMALARSGASTLNELAAFGIPSLLVPYPYAAEDHQTKNALIFSQAGAAVLIPQSDLAPETLAKTLTHWLEDKEAFGKAGQAARALSVSGSANMICEIIESSIAAKNG